jgi:uncharacterized protein (TIGR02145 family)
MKNIFYSFLFTCTITFFLTCKDKPTAPVFDNPLDRNNPVTQGDPFHLQVSRVEGGVKLQWTAVDMKTVSGYNIYRSEAENSDFAKIDGIASGPTTYVDKNVQNGSYWYKVNAYINSGAESSLGNISPVRIDVTGLTNRAPFASFTVVPGAGDTRTDFVFDASGSSDYEDDVSSLQVRWDWENDGIWDTNYSTAKTANHQFSITGIITVKLEVQDTGGLTANTTRQITVIEAGTMTDIDGNVYHTVKIGNQWWMAENLKVSRYRNGDAIPFMPQNTDWSNLETGAYGYYNNDANNEAIYGRLYNWYAVDDSRNLAPAGWHVPNDVEWSSCVEYLGGDPVAGGKMKSSGYTHWDSPNTGATNESGFSALPGGYRSSLGDYFFMGSSAFFWSSMEINGANGWSCSLNCLYSNVYSHTYGKRYGLSVRLVKD